MATDSASSPQRGRSCLGWLALLAVIGWLLWLIYGLVRIIRLISCDRGRVPTGAFPSHARRQPDPMIYSQSFLMSQGLAVTWQNPDIHMEQPEIPGVHVDPHALLPDTDYLVIARIWNGSPTAPVAWLPVHFSYLEFGITTVSHDIGMTNVDLSVKGGSQCPAFATIPWRTPAIPGHYCLQVDLLWTDDSQPANNLGQHNTVVKPLNSPRATFSFPVRNPGPNRRAIHLEIDAYRIPPPLHCPRQESVEQRQKRQADAIRRNQRSAWPIPPGWQVDIQPTEFVLAPTQTTSVTVDITAPDGFTGRQAINIHAFDNQSLLGGVTLLVDGTG